MQCGDFYSMWRLLCSMETWMQYRDFYPERFLSSVETFMQYGGCNPAKRLLVSEIFTKCEDFYPV